MRQDIKLIRKQFRITRQEDNKIKEMMREQQLESFSEFLRQNLLKKESKETDFEKYWGISSEQAKQVLYMVENEFDTTEIEAELDAVNREFRRNRILDLMLENNQDKISKFSREKSISYMYDIKEKYPMIYDKQRVAPEQVMLMGAMGCNAVKKLVLDNIGELNDLSFEK